MSAALAGAIIPAAGLGTRLRPLSAQTPKELLPLGGEPAILGALLEAHHAGLGRVAVVRSPEKEAMESVVEGVAASLGVEVRWALQEAPLGVLDAVARGRALLGEGDVVVLYPDYVSLPGQRGLGALVRAWRRHQGVVFGLVRVSAAFAARAGRTALAEAVSLGGGEHRIEALRAVEALAPGALHTTFAEIRGARYEALLEERRGGGALHDGLHLPVLGALAAQGALFGAEVEGELLDVGVMAGYEDAAARFARGEAAWSWGGR
jgi:UTP-glucose-1-phosphate uridylyltransferase